MIQFLIIYLFVYFNTRLLEYDCKLSIYFFLYRPFNNPHHNFNIFITPITIPFMISYFNLVVLDVCFFCFFFKNTFKTHHIVKQNIDMGQFWGKKQKKTTNKPGFHFFKVQCQHFKYFPPQYLRMTFMVWFRERERERSHTHL